MQKTNKNASILIWAMFLSMIILVAFVSINNQILRNLNENSMITNNKDENIIYDAENYLKIGLKKGEELKIKASTGKTTIKILEGSPVEVNGELVMKTFSSESMDFDIKNLGGYSLVELSTENKFEKNYKSYKIIKKVGNNFVIKERGKVY